MLKAKKVISFSQRVVDWLTANQSSTLLVQLPRLQYYLNFILFDQIINSSLKDTSYKLILKISLSISRKEIIEKLKLL